MKIRLEKDGTAFEYEKSPMPEHRFKAVCFLIAAVVYGWMLVQVAALCGIVGVVAVSVISLFVSVIAIAPKL